MLEDVDEDGYASSGRHQSDERLRKHGQKEHGLHMFIQGSYVLLVEGFDTDIFVQDH